MTTRTTEDRLREEYFLLLPDVRRLAERMDAEIKHCLLPISSQLTHHEQLVVKVRIKECESAVASLRRRQEGAIFDRAKPASYSLTSLKDLVGVRVLVFPKKRISEIKAALCAKYSDWEADPVLGKNDDVLAYKYFGYCDASTKVKAEFQVVPMLIGLFWEVEHSAIYKPDARFKGAAKSLEMRERTHDVLQSLNAFEENFENLVERSLAGPKVRK